MDRFEIDMQSSLVSIQLFIPQSGSRAWCVIMIISLIMALFYFPSFIYSAISGHKIRKESFQYQNKNITPSPQFCAPRTTSNDFKSAKRGHIAILYSGTVRSLSVTFHSHLVNLIIPSPYHVHIFMHASTGRFDWKTPSVEHPHTGIYRGFKATMKYYNAFDNIDNERVSLMNDVVKYAEISDGPLDMNISAYFNYTEIFNLIGKRHDAESKPASVAGQLDSLRRANQARLDYEHANHIKYQWIVRLRMDHLMKTNVWEDLFVIEPLNGSDPYHQTLLNQSIIKSTQSKTNHENSYWNGGLLYDMVYIPRQDSNLTSPDHETSLFVPTCEWWYGVTDQFAIGGSRAITKYSERMNVPLISQLAKQNGWILWAEPLVKQLIDYEKLSVYMLRHVYNIIRVIHTNRSLHENTFTASKCIYIWYGRHCHRDHCSYWIDRFKFMQMTMLNRSQQHQDILLQNETYANLGPIAQEGFSHYIKYLHSVYQQFFHGNQQLSAKKQKSLDDCFARQSNYFYFWRHRSPKHMLQCVMPAPAVDPVQALVNPLEPRPEFTPFDIFAHHFYPFITETTDPASRHRYKQSLVCNLE